MTGASSTSPERALQGVRILDLTRLLPGAFCTQILADMGADVLKIEEPGRGDYNREFLPLARTESGSFLLLNRNKKSMTLNLKSAAGKEIFKRLVNDADIVIEGFRPGVMTRLGVDFETLRQINPRLVYCAISGFGQDGPYRLRSGHDLNYMALSGALQLFGKKGEGPMVPGLSIADVGGGSLMAVAGILGALFARSRTGRGQFVDISMTDGTMSWLTYHGAEYLFGGVEPRGGELPFIGQAPCYNVYECADGRHVALGIIEFQFWERFCQATGFTDLVDDQWPTGAAAEEQFRLLRNLFLTRDRDDWVAEFDRIDIPFSPVLDIQEALSDPQNVYRRMLMHVDHPVEGRVPQLGFPIKLSDTPCDVRMPPPVLGEHSRSELSAAGYSQAEIDRFVTEKVI